MKRFLSLALALVMVFGMIPMASAATCANGHSVTIDPPEDYDCTVGYTRTVPCEVDGCNGEATETVAPKAHTITEWTESPDFNCETGGSRTGYCTVCGKQVTENHSGTHAYGEPHDVVAATCSKDGSQKKTCSVCGYVKTEPLTKDPTKHDFTANTGKCTNTDADGKVCDAEDPDFEKYTLSITAPVTVNVGNTAAVSVSMTLKEAYKDSNLTISGVTWSGANEFVSYTESTDGKSVTVKGLKKGSATITATVQTSDNKSKPLTCTVTVNDDLSISVPAYINIDESSLVSDYITATLAGKPTGSTHNYDEKFTYKVTGGTAISVDETTGKITTKHTGVATITTTVKYKGTDGAEVTKTATTDVSVYCDIDITVTMIAGRVSFDFDEYAAIGETKQNKSVMAQIMAGANTGAHNGCHVYFTTYEDRYGKLTMAGGTGNLRASTVGMLGDVRFTPLATAGGKFSTSYKIQDASMTNNNKGLIYGTGTLNIKFGEGAGAIKYKTTNNKAIQFVEKDFKDFWTDAGFTGTPSYVMFGGQPKIGDLYTNSTLKTKTVNTDKYYFTATGTKLDLEKVTYDPSDLSAKYSDEIYFTMVGGTNDTDLVYGTIVIEVGQVNPFVDVKTTDYFYDAVMWAVEKEITTGTSATTFSPSQVCTRGQVVTFLWRAAGEPAARTTVNPFSDVKKNDYFYEAVLWAYEKGITTGITATTFGPNQAITRSQAVTFLYRYNNEPAVTGTNSFVDVSSTAFYAKAVTWAVKSGITNGMSATKFAPNDGCTRAQIVTFLYRDAK